MARGSGEGVGGCHLLGSSDNPVRIKALKAREPLWAPERLLQGGRCAAALGRATGEKEQPRALRAARAAGRRGGGSVPRRAAQLCSRRAEGRGRARVLGPRDPRGQGRGWTGGPGSSRGRADRQAAGRADRRRARPAGPGRSRLRRGGDAAGRDRGGGGGGGDGRPDARAPRGAGMWSG